MVVTANNQPEDPSPLLGPLMSSVTLKLPEFWYNLPKAWISKIESQFLERHHVVTASPTKFNMVIGAFPQIVVTK